MEPVSSQFEYDVFLSHNRADKDWTRMLAARIERETWNGRALKAFYSERDIRPGQSIPQRMQYALTQSCKIALILSPEALASPWVEVEYLSTLYADVSKRREHLIPLIRRDCTPPYLVAPLRFIDFRDDANFERAFAELLAVIKDEELPQESSTAPPVLRVSPMLHVLPSPTIGFVTRRDKEGRDIVEYVGELLQKENAFVALWGEGGIGKTALGAEIARKRSGIVWASADGRPDFSLGSLLDEIVTQLGRADLRTLAPEKKAEEARNLLNNAHSFLALDNFETIADAEQKSLIDFLANAPCPALVTSRQMIPHAHSVRIDAMGETEASEFVNKLIEISARREVFVGLDAKEIISAAVANPLAMQWIVAQIEEAREPRRVFDELSRGEGDAAQRIFDRSFNLPFLGDDGRRTLLVLSLFLPDASRDGIAQVADLWSTQISNVITRLVSLRLANTTTLNERVGISGLTRELTTARLATENRAKKWKRRFVRFFLRYAKMNSKPAVEDFDALNVERKNLFAAMDIAFSLKDWESVINIRMLLEEFLDSRGYWDDAVERGEQALRAATRYGDSFNFAALTHNIGNMYAARGDYEEAKRRFERAMQIAKEVKAEQGLAAGFNQLGSLAHKKGDYETARKYYGESLEIAKSMGDLRGVAYCLHNLGLVAHDQSDHNGAIEYYSKSLSLKRKLGDRRGLVSTLMNLGMIAHESEDYQLARQRYSECLEIARNFGDQNNIADSLYHLGMAAQSLGESETARKYYNQSLEIKRQLRDRNGIAHSLAVLALLEIHAEDFGKARKQTEEALAIFKEIGQAADVENARVQLQLIDSMSRLT